MHEQYFQINFQLSFMEILIFKTSVHSNDLAQLIIEQLNQHELINQVTFDLEDIDKILRIEALNEAVTNDIIQTIQNKGIQIEELVDNV